MDRLFAAANNDLSGSLPASLGALLLLQYLDLHSNGLTGSVPNAMSTLTGLQYLDLSSDQLSGELPDGFGGFGNLTFFNVSGNGALGGQCAVVMSCIAIHVEQLQ